MQSLFAAYVDWLLTASVALTVASLAAAWLRRYTLASLGFLTLGSGAIAIVWDDWSRRTGYHMELLALLHPVALSSRETFLLITHAPLMVAGFAFLFALSSRAKEASLSRSRRGVTWQGHQR